MRTAAMARSGGILRHSHWDAVLIALSGVHGALLITAPSIWVIALGFWWNSNTIAHNFIHLPFFRSVWMNRAFSAWLTLLLGVPQALWRQRHLAHHAERCWHFHFSRQLALESCLVVALWGTIVICAPLFFAKVYLPGIALGLAFCHLQGRYEHLRGTVSHYGRLYNWLLFNDGYHAEHHERPSEHWRQLPHRKVHHAASSRWPAVLRWFDPFNLTMLEKMVLQSRWLQQLVPFRRLWPRLKHHGKAVIVGGALFPRTALIVERLAPEMEIEVIDCRAEHIDRARVFFGSGVRFVEQHFSPAQPGLEGNSLLVIPLSFDGDREAVYQMQSRGSILVHDWIWRRRGVGVVVSWLLLKRLNLIEQDAGKVDARTTVPLLPAT